MGFDRTSQGIGRLGDSLEDLFRGIADRKQKEEDRAAHGRFVKNAFDLIDAPDPATFEPEMIEPESPGLLDYSPDGAPQYMDGRPAPVEPEIPRKKLGQRDLIQMYMLDAEDPAPQNVDFLKQISDILNQSAKTEGMLEAAGLRAEASRYGADSRLMGSVYGADSRLSGTKYGADSRLRGVEDTNDSREGMNRRDNQTRLEVERMRSATAMARAAQVKSQKDRVTAITDPAELDRMLAEVENQLKDHADDSPNPENYDSFDGVQREAYEQNAVYWHKINNDLRSLRNSIRTRQAQLANDAAAVPPPGNPRGQGGPAPAGVYGSQPGAAPSPAPGKPRAVYNPATGRIEYR